MKKETYTLAEVNPAFMLAVMLIDLANNDADLATPEEHKKAFYNTRYRHYIDLPNAEIANLHNELKSGK